MNNVRFVVVATTQRGALERSEVLDDANQWRAFSAWRMSESRDQRVAFEMDDAVVMWAKPRRAQVFRRKVG